MDRTCADCGKESHGYRCRACHGKFERERGLRETEKRDREIIAMAVGGMSGARLAARLGVSRARASQLLRISRQREEARQQRG